MNKFTWVFLIVLVLMTAIELWLSLRQSAYVHNHRDSVPDAFSEQISLSSHQKAASYTVAKGRLNRVATVVGMVILLAWTLGGGLQYLVGFWQEFGWSTAVTGVVFILSFFVIGSY